jgi:phytoene dehydrogenase-like protein
VLLTTTYQHQDFYVTYQLLNHFLLGYYRAFFQDPAAADKSLYKFQAEVQAYHRSWETKYRRLTREIDDLTERLRLEAIAREKEAMERQTADAVAQGLKDELQAQESWWHW